MKSEKIKKSLFISIFIVAIFRLLFLFIPFYSSEAKILVPNWDIREDYEINLGVHTAKGKCLNFKVNFDELNDQTIFNLTSRSFLKKQKSIKCIEDGVNYIKSEINNTNSKVRELSFISITLNNKIEDLIKDFNSSKILDKDKLILLNDYFSHINTVGAYKNIPLPLPYQIKTIPISVNGLFRYLFSCFILFFWISYVLLDYFKKKNND